MLYEKIRILCMKKNYSINRLEQDIGVSRGSICRWDKNKPSYEKIILVADKLDITVDELVR